MHVMIKALTIVAAVASCSARVGAEPVRWTVYRIPETGTSVDIPTSIFSEMAGRPDGYGQRFQTADGRASLTVQSAARDGRETPAEFLAKKNPPSSIQYKRITPRFFAVSSTKGDYVWYNRCNFTAAHVHCVLINYPQAWERAWDGLVTRISLSLNRGQGRPTAAARLQSGAGRLSRPKPARRVWPKPDRRSPSVV